MTEVEVVGCDVAHLQRATFTGADGSEIGADWGAVPGRADLAWVRVPLLAVEGIAFHLDDGRAIASSPAFRADPSVFVVDPRSVEHLGWVRIEGVELDRIDNVTIDGARAKIFHGDLQGEHAKTLLYAQMPGATFARSGPLTLHEGPRTYNAGPIELKPRASGGAPAPCVGLSAHPEIQGARCATLFSQGDGSDPYPGNECECALHYRARGPAQASWGAEFTVLTAGASWTADGTASSPATVCLKSRFRCYQAQGAWETADAFRGTVPFEAPAGSYQIEIRRADGIAVDSGTDRIEIPRPPFYFSLDKTTAAPGETVRLNAGGIAQATKVTFGGAVATTVADGEHALVATLPPDARSGAVVVEMPSGDRSYGRAFFIVKGGPPAPSGYAPGIVGARGLPLQTLAIEGLNLGLGSAVRFCANGTCTPSASALGTATRVVAAFPALAPGEYDIEVKNAGSDWVRVGPRKLTVAQAPLVTSVSYAQEGDLHARITVRGSGFVGVEEVLLLAPGGTEGESEHSVPFQPVSSTEIQASVALTRGIIGSFAVLVHAAGGSAIGSALVSIAHPEPIEILGFEPREGIAGSALAVTTNTAPGDLGLCLRPIAGGVCYPALGASRRSMALVSVFREVSVITRNDPAMIDDVVTDVRLPYGLAPGDYHIVASVAGSPSDTSADLDPPAFRVLPGAPEIASVTPTSGRANTKVTIAGANFVAPLVVSAKPPGFDHFVPLPRWEEVDAATIRFDVPIGSPSGAYTLKVSTLGGEAISATGAFNVPAGAFTLAKAPPTITAFSPASGAVGTSLTIQGTNFERPTVACLQIDEDCHLLPTTIKSATELESTVPDVGVAYAQGEPGQGPNVPVPALARPLAGGAYTVRVMTLGGQADSSALAPATFALQARPYVTRVAPALGPAGTQIVLSGSGLAGATAVRFGDAAVAFEARDEDLVLRAPASAGYGPRRIEVTTPGGEAIALQRFVLSPAAPRVTGFEPTEFVPGATDYAPGQRTFPFNISGENLLGPVQVCLLGPAGCTTTASATSASGDGRLLAFDVDTTLPPGPYLVQVATLGGAHVLTSAAFVVHPPARDDVLRQPAPRITSFTPTSGEPPFDVEIRGSGFETAYGVQLRLVTRLAPNEAIGNLLGATVDAPGPYVAFDRVSDNHLRARFPEGLTSGKYVVAVHTLGGVASTRHPDGESVAESATSGIASDLTGQAGDPDGEIEVQGSLFGAYAPNITGFSPASARPADAVTLVGTNLGPYDPEGVFLNAPLTSVGVRLRVPGTEREFTAMVTSSRPAGALSDSIEGVGSDLTDWRVEFVVPDMPVGDYEIVLQHIFGKDDTRGLAPSTISILPRRGLEPPEIHRIETGADPSRFTLHGRNLTQPYTACLDTGVCVLLAPTTSSGDGTWASFRVPPLAPSGEHAVSLHKAGGVARSPTKIVVPPAVPAPTITNIVPDRGAATMKIHVQGRDFPAALAPCMEAEGNCHPMLLDQIATTSFWAYPAPTTPLGTFKIRISSTAGAAVSPDTFTLVAPPAIVKVTPEEGARPGETITIEGRYFQRASVTYGNKPLVDMKVNADGTSITGKVPADATPADIIVRVTTDVGSTTHVVKTRLPRPIIESWTPQAGVEGVRVDVRGTNLAPITKLCVRLVGTSAPCRSVPPPIHGGPDPRTSFTFLLRPGASETLWGAASFTPGVYSIEVTTPEGTFKTADLATRGVTLLARPDITSVSPGSGSPGDLVTIAGSGFRQGAKVFFGATQAEIVSSTSTRIVARVPLFGAGTASGAIPVKVETDVASDLAPRPFTYLPRVIVIESASPSHARAGALVTLSGRGFTGANDVEVGGVDAPGLRVVSDTRIEFRVPSGAPRGPVTIKVASPASPPGFRAFIVDYPPPVITSISKHAAQPGEFFWIEGRDLGGTYWACLGYSDGCVGLGYPNPVRGNEPADSNERIYVKIPLRTSSGYYRPEVTTPGGTAKYVGEALRVSWS